MPPKISAIVLAAGRSTRMGRCKQLLPLADRPVLAHTLNNLNQAGIDQVVVVLGASGAEVAAAVNTTGLLLVSNPDPKGDMSSSVRAGLGALDPRCSGILVCLADMPLVQRSTIRLLVQAHQQHPDAILIPAYGGKNGHPPLFPFHLLGNMTQNTILKDLVRTNRSQVRTLAVDDPGVVIDMDTPADFQKVQRIFPSKG